MLFLLAAAAGLALADASIVVLALPPLLREFDTTVEGVAAVLTGRRKVRPPPVGNRGGLR